MFDKWMGKLDDFDFDRVKEVVNLVWNNREKLMDLLENLPELLRDTGESIESAGESAVKASNFLAGDDGANAGEMSKLASKALDSCTKEVAAAARIMASLGDELDAIRIPSIKPKYIDVLGSKVVGGLDFGEEGIMDNAAERLKNGAERLTDISSDLQKVSVNIRELGSALTEAGKDLNNVGVQLKQSGGKLRSLTNNFSQK